MTAGQSYSFSGRHWTFQLPREHGAVLVFSLSCIISLLICHTDPLYVAGSQLILWSMILSLHREEQLLIVATIGIIVLQLLSGTSAATWIAVVWAGSHVARSSSRKGFWWKEALGLSGSALAPIVLSYLLNGNFMLHLIVLTTLLAAIFTGTAFIRVTHKETGVTPLPTAVFSLILWLCLAATAPVIASLSLIPYVAQSIWILQSPRASFKQLGQAQSLCLCWTATVIALHVFKLV